MEIPANIGLRRMLLLELVLTLGLLAVCSFTPGFFFVRRFRWTPLEKLCGSIGLSLLMLFLASWLVYLSTGGSDSERLPFWCVSAVCVALGIAARRDIARLFHARRVRQATGAYGFLLLWTLLILGMIRSYSGGTWFGDWLEHFQRSLFFLHHFPLHTVLFGEYALPARPPMMNVLGAFFMAQSADRFEVFQLTFTFLNLLVFLPCCLIMPALAGARKQRILPLLCLFALNPVVIENATYSWTKLFSAFYVVLAICLYLAGWRKRDRGRMTAAFLALSAGILVHYSAAPYLLLLGGHYLFFVFPRAPAEMAGGGVHRGALCGAAAGLVRVVRQDLRNACDPGIQPHRHLGPAIPGQYRGKSGRQPFRFAECRPLLGILRPSSDSTSRIPPRRFAITCSSSTSPPDLGYGPCGRPADSLASLFRLERRKGCKPEGRFWLAFVPCCVLVGIRWSESAIPWGTHAKDLALPGSHGAGAAGRDSAGAAGAGRRAGSRFHRRLLPGHSVAGTG